MSLSQYERTSKSDPIYVDCQMRLIQAAAWSSDYEMAEKIAKDMMKNEISSKYETIAGKALDELPKLRAERTKLDERH